MRVSTLILAAIAGLGLAAAATAARPVDSSAILDALNAERAANGIPADVRENGAWSAKCADHVAYMAAAGSLTHTEDPSSARYTASGSWAGRNSVLAFGESWGSSDPFETSPLHLIQLMSPELHQIGVADDSSGYLCVTTWPGYKPSAKAKPAVYTYPGDGVVGVPAAETASEIPFVPSEFVGLPQGTRTGFNIMVFAEGLTDPWLAHIVSATLTGPHDRAVAVKTVDRTTPTVGAYLPPGSGFVIPAAPLRPGTRYQATVRFAGGPSYTWSFTTGGR